MNTEAWINRAKMSMTAAEANTHGRRTYELDKDDPLCGSDWTLAQTL